MPSGLKPHKQVPAKVAAYADDGIEGLVGLLNTFNAVQTTGGCEEDQDGYVYVFMYYRVDGKLNPHEVIDLTRYLVDAIREVALKHRFVELVGLATEISVSSEWLGRSYPIVAIEVPRDARSPVTTVFAALPHEFSCNKEDKQE